MAEILQTLSSTGSGTAPDFTSILTWESQGLDLVSAGDTMVLECYKGTTVNGNWQADGSLEENVNISGWVTDDTHFITVRAAPGNAHGGVSGAGFHMTESSSATDIITCPTAYTVIQDIEAINKRAAFNSSSVFYMQRQFKLERCMASLPNITGGTAYCFEFGTLTATGGVVRNCVASPSAGSTTFGFIQSNTATFTTFENCTAFGLNSNGFQTQAGDTLKNCVAYDIGGTDFFGSSTGSTNNSSEDGSAPGANPVTGISAVDFETDGVTPKVGGLVDGAINPGADLSLNFTDDITGYTRPDPASWERGAYEIQSGEPEPDPSIAFTGPNIADQAGTESELFVMSQTTADSFTVQDGTATYALAPTSSALPTGLTVNPDNGDVVGTVGAGTAVGSPYTNIIIRGTVEAAAVYGRWDAASITFAQSVGGGLTADEYQINTVTDGTSTVKSDIGHVTGVHYFEIVCKGTIANAMVGMSDGSAHNGFPGSSAGSLAYWSKNGQIRESGANLGGHPTIPQTITSVYGVIVDIDAATISWFVDGVAGPQDWSLSLIVAEAGGISNLRPAVGNGSTTDTYEYRINAGQETFAHPENIPDGCHLGWGIDVPVKAAPATLDDTNAFSITIAPAPVPIYFTGTISNIVGETGTPITPVDTSGNFDGSETPFTYAETGTAWPTWLNLDVNTGIITGTPTAAGNTSGHTVTGTDTATSTDASNTFSVNVTDAPVPISFTGTITDITGEVGTPIAPQDVSNDFSGSRTPFTYAKSGTAWPGWLNLDVNTGIISGTPDVDSVTTGHTVTGTDQDTNTAVSNGFSVTAIAAAIKERRFYPMNEGSGDVITDTSAGQDGTWSDALNWYTVAANSRFYPSDDDAGTLADILGDGSTDATIVNYNPSEWDCGEGAGPQ